MTDTEKLRGWILWASQEGTLAAWRWVRSVDKLSTGTYETKDAFSDWYFLASRWLAMAPPAPAPAPAKEPLLILSVNAGEATTVGTVLVSKANSPTIAADLEKVGDSSKTIAKGKFAPTLHNGGRTLLVSASGLAGLSLAVGDVYTGSVTDGGTAIARIELYVLG